jgi:hypothetical protein
MTVAPTWKDLAALLAHRLTYQAFCDEHAETRPGVDCPSCEDRAAVRAYERKAGRRLMDHPAPDAPSGGSIRLQLIRTWERVPTPPTPLVEVPCDQVDPVVSTLLYGRRAGAVSARRFLRKIVEATTQHDGHPVVESISQALTSALTSASDPSLADVDHISIEWS